MLLKRRVVVLFAYIQVARAAGRARGSDGLVCSLSAKGLQHVSTEDGFAGKRKGFGSTDEVDVRRAQYEHARVVRVFERHRI